MQLFFGLKCQINNLQRTCRFNLENSFDVNILHPLTYLNHSNIQCIFLYYLYNERILVLKSKKPKGLWDWKYIRLVSNWLIL